MAATERQLVLFARAHASAFQQWLTDNPRVWELFVAFTQQAIGAGFAHYSADAICHRIRWHVQIETRDDSGWKINNNHVAYLARRYEQIYPQHAGFFRMREQRSA
jgi:hypothetical protein